MLHSMTGYGRAENTLDSSTLLIEIKSLNGKQFDLFNRLPQSIKPYEIELKNILQKAIGRGSVELNVYLKQHGNNKPMRVNTDLAAYYYNALSQLSSVINEPIKDALSTIVSLPEVISTDTEAISESDWDVLKKTTNTALLNLNKFREQEGAMLKSYLKTAIENIVKHTDQLQQFEQSRIDKIRDKLQMLIADVQSQKVDIDKNRLEQELVYYVEKLDINEEKSRLHHHCNYFFEILLDEGELQKGKKLGFILQEIGREINTIGSKANDAGMQKLVVQMKDELEKAKEQTLNVL